MSMMKMHRDELKKIKTDLEEPAENQAKDNIRPDEKFALVFANANFSRK